MGSKRSSRRELLKGGAALAGGFTALGQTPASGQAPAHDHSSGQAPAHDNPMITANKELIAYGQRLGWKAEWASSLNSDFNFDYHVSATETEKKQDKAYYNYETSELMSDEMPGLSVFYKDTNGDVFHTYSTYGRGLDMLIGTYHFLDLTPKGRDENPESPMEWIRRHDDYGTV